MRTSQQGIDLIRHFEGERLTPYLDAAGFPTIGVGHLLTAAEAVQHAGGITPEQSAALLRLDLARAARGVLNCITVPLTQGEFDALVSFVFNLGHGRLNASTLRSKLNRGDRRGAADEFLKWRMAGGRVLPGLVRRRTAERALFLSHKRN